MQVVAGEVAEDDREDPHCRPGPERGHDRARERPARPEVPGRDEAIEEQRHHRDQHELQAVAKQLAAEARLHPDPRGRAVGEAAAIAIGATVGLDAIFGGPVTGASMNPARSLGPGLVSGDLTGIWIYLLAPAVGAAAGAVLYEMATGRCPFEGKTPASVIAAA